MSAPSSLAISMTSVSASNSCAAPWTAAGRPRFLETYVIEGQIARQGVRWG